MAGGSDMDCMKIGPFGTPTGKSWDGKGHSNIVQILVSHETCGINSIQYQYAAENGQLNLSELHGNPRSRKFDVVNLNYPKEYITCIRGYTACNNGGLYKITFGTNLGEYGPFGGSGNNKPVISWKSGDEFCVKLGENRQFFGFYGTTNNGFVNSIGVYMKFNMTLGLVKKERIN